MQIPLQVTFRNITPSGAIEANIREKAAKLDSLYDQIMSCRVTVEAPHRRRRKGKAYHVRIDLTVPGGELVVNRAAQRLDADRTRAPEESENELTESHEPGRHAAHEDIYVAIRDAFNAAGRKLQDYARKRRGKTKRHESGSFAFVSRIFPEEGFGFLENAEGREIYFHRNSVLQPGFDRLNVGTKVHFAEEVGEKGPQASTVRIAG